MRGARAKMRSAGGFTPLALPGLLWFVHPDDATDIILNGTTGDLEINSIIDRKGGKTFAANAAANRMILDTTERPGHQVAVAKTSNADWLRCADATLAQSLVATGAYTFFTWHRYAAVSAGSIQFIMMHNTSTSSLGGSSVTNAVRLWHNAGSPGSMTWAIADSSATNFQWGAVDGFTGATTWQSIIGTNDGAGNMELWQNGISLGVKSGTPRSPTGMIGAHFGGGASGANFFYHGPKGALQGVLSASNISKLHNWLTVNA